MSLSRKNIINYAIGSLGDSAAYVFINTYMLYFLTTQASIMPGLAGTIVAIGAAWNAVWSPLMGTLSDRTPTRWGKRYPYIAGMSFPLFIVIILLYSGVGGSYLFRVLFYTILVLLFWTVYTGFLNPYMALGAEITSNYYERTRLRSYAYAFNLVGCVIGMTTPSVLMDLANSGHISDTFIWIGSGLIVGLCTFLSIIVSCLFTYRIPSIQTQIQLCRNIVMERKKILSASAVQNKTSCQKNIQNLFRDFFQIIHMKPARYLLLASITFLAANTIFNADRMYFFTYNLNLSASQITFALIFTSATGALFIPLVLKIAKKKDKRSTYILLMTVSAVLMLITYFVKVDSFATTLLFIAVYTCGNSCYWQLLPSMIYDICEIDQFLYGKRREAFIVSLQPLSESFSAAISVQLLGFLLEFQGFKGNTPIQTAEAMSCISFCLTILPALFMLLSAFMVWNYPVTEKVYQKIHANLLKSAEKDNESEVEQIRKQLL